MEYGIIYLKVCPPSGHHSEWMKHCFVNSELALDDRNKIDEISSGINSKYASDIIIPMDSKLHPGCVCTTDSVRKIATEMYNGYVSFFESKLGIECVRCVYSVGEISDVNVKSTHYLGYDDVVIKVGRFLDSSDETGLFKI